MKRKGALWEGRKWHNGGYRDEEDFSSHVLTEELIHATHINRYRQLLESIRNGRYDHMDKTTSPGKRGLSKLNVSKSTSGKNGIAVHGFKKINSVAIGLLHDRRERSKTAFAELRGYVIFDWEMNKKKVSQKKMQLDKENPNFPSVASFKPIPDTVVQRWFGVFDGDEKNETSGTLV